MTENWKKKIPKNARAILYDLYWANIPLKKIGEQLGGISSQRVHQLLFNYDIIGRKKLPRPRLNKKPSFARSNNKKAIWLWRRLQLAGKRLKITKEERITLYKHMVLILPEICPVLGLTLKYVQEKAGCSDDRPSIDRINNAIGYIPGNVRVISWRANRIKNDGTAEEHEMIAQYMRKCMS